MEKKRKLYRFLVRLYVTASRLANRHSGNCRADRNRHPILTVFKAGGFGSRRRYGGRDHSD